MKRPLFSHNRFTITGLVPVVGLISFFALPSGSASPSPSPKPSSTPNPPGYVVPASALPTVVSSQPTESQAVTATFTQAGQDPARIAIAQSYATENVILACRFSRDQVTPVKSGGCLVLANTSARVAAPGEVALPAGSQITGMAVVSTDGKSLSAEGPWRVFLPGKKRIETESSITSNALLFRVDPSKMTPSQRLKAIDLPVANVKSDANFYVMLLKSTPPLSPVTAPSTAATSKPAHEPARAGIQ